MAVKHDVAGVSATERAVVGLCHDINNRLASLSAYAFVLNKRGLLGENADPIQAQLDGLAHSVRLIRSLCRDVNPEIGPLSLRVIAEGATELMITYPEGPVCFEAEVDDSGGVVRCDWAAAQRSLLLAGVWLRRGLPWSETAVVVIRPGAGANSITLEARIEDPTETGEALLPDNHGDGVSMESVGPRTVQISFSPTA